MLPVVRGVADDRSSGADLHGRAGRRDAGARACWTRSERCTCPAAVVLDARAVRARLAAVARPDHRPRGRPVSLLAAVPGAAVRRRRGERGDPLIGGSGRRARAAAERRDRRRAGAVRDRRRPARTVRRRRRPRPRVRQRRAADRLRADDLAADRRRADARAARADAAATGCSTSAPARAITPPCCRCWPAEVCTIERHPELSAAARPTRSPSSDCDNVTCVVGDGSRGLPDRAPFDAINVAAAAGGRELPPALRRSAALGGRLVGAGRSPASAPGARTSHRGRACA